MFMSATKRARDFPATCATLPKGAGLEISATAVEFDGKAARPLFAFKLTERKRLETGSLLTAR